MIRTKFSITSWGVIQRLTNVGSFNWRGVTSIVHFTETHQNDSGTNYSTTAIQLNNWGSFHQGNFLFPCGFHVKHILCSHSIPAWNLCRTSFSDTITLHLFSQIPKFIYIMENIVAGEDHYPIKIHASTFVSCWMSSNLEALSLCFTCRGTKGSLWAAYHGFKGTVPISTECNKHGLRTCPVELSHVSCVTQIKAWFFGLPSTFVAGFYLVWQISSIWSWAVIQLIWSNRQAPTGHIHNPNQRHIQCCFDHQFFSVKSLFYELEKDVLVSI